MANVTKKPAPALPDSIKITLEDDLHHRLRDAVDALSGPPERLRLTDVLRSAIEREVKRLETKHHDGKPFPRRAT